MRKRIGLSTLVLSFVAISSTAAENALRRKRKVVQVDHATKSEFGLQNNYRDLSTGGGSIKGDKRTKKAKSTTDSGEKKTKKYNNDAAGDMFEEAMADWSMSMSMDVNVPTGTPAPVPVVTTAPIPMTMAPVLPATSAPVLPPPTTAPVVATAAPVVLTAAPVPATSAPVIATAAPVIATAAPVVATPAPVIATSVPVVATPAPVIATAAPIIATPAPVVVTMAPVVPPTLAPVMNTTIAPTSGCGALGREEALEDVLLEITEAPILADPTLPQGQALRWLVDTDPAQIDPCTYPTVAQRYALTTLYYSTGADSSTNVTGWLSAEGECTWPGVRCTGDVVTSIVLCKCINLFLPDYAIIIFLTSTINYSREGTIW